MLCVQKYFVPPYGGTRWKKWVYVILYIYMHIHTHTCACIDLSPVQVGVLGEEEEWVSLHEVDNEPDAQMLEVPNLTPYTHYR